jgi:hypothetical protein|tara:strand:- start:942 stop:1181 length:240 start_codon:yes stop_codon:yes gene_type:complete
VDWDFEEGVILADGFDDCIIGKDYQSGKAVYGIERIIESLMLNQEMSVDESIEYFDFNIGCAYVGEMTPIYIWQGETYH